MRSAFASLLLLAAAVLLAAVTLGAMLAPLLRGIAAGMEIPQ